MTMIIDKKIVATLFVLIFTCLLTSGQKRILDVTPVYSGPSNWCWANVSSMFSVYYFNNNEAVCNIVEWARLNVPWINLGNDNCCSSPDSCNNGQTPDTQRYVLLNHLGITSDEKDVLSLSSIYYVINNNRPLSMICSTSGSGGGHEMMLYGYEVINQNDAYIHYVDNGVRYTDLYSAAITTPFCLGMFDCIWSRGSIVPTTNFCPTNLTLYNNICANASIHAQSNIIINGNISNNCNVSLTAGSSITLNSGFEIQSGSSLTAATSTTPCQ